METVLDLNSLPVNQNNPVYCLLPKRKPYFEEEEEEDSITNPASRYKEKIHRIPGYRSDEMKDADLVAARAEYLKEDLDPDTELDKVMDSQGMQGRADGTDSKILMRGVNMFDVAVYMKARRFCVVFPFSYLKESASTLFDIINGSGNLPDAYALKTVQLLQVLFFLLSPEGLERTWADALPIERQRAENKKNAKGSKKRGRGEDEEGGGGGEDTGDVIGGEGGEDDPLSDPMLVRDLSHSLEGIAGRKGDPDDTKFTLLNSSTRNRVTYDRFVVDLVTVDKRNTQKTVRLNSKTFDLENTLLHDDIECFLFVFSIIDPLLSLSRGVYRSMMLNVRNAKEVTKRKVLKAATAEKVDYRVDDTSAYVWDLKCKNAVDDILRPSDFYEMLSVATSMPIRFIEKFRTDPDKSDWYRESSQYNITNVLSLTPNSGMPYLWGPRGKFSYSTLNRPTKLDIFNKKVQLKDSEFLALPEVDFPSQMRDIDLVSTEVIEKDYYDEEGERTVIAEEIEIVNATSMMMHFYPYPNKVIRYSDHHIDPYLLGSVLLPCYINSDRQTLNLETDYNIQPTRNRRFPTITPSQTANLRVSLDALKKRLKAKTPDTERVILCSADVIRQEVFRVQRSDRKFTAAMTPEMDLKERMETAYSLVTRTLRADSPSLSPSMAAVVKYVETEQHLNPGFSIFPDIYGETYKFDVFLGGYTCASQALININHRYLDTAYALRDTHRHLFRLMFLSVASAQLRFGMQPTVLYLGDPGCGKSNMFLVMLNSSIPGLVQRIDSSTKQATSTITSNAGLIHIMDESDASAPFVSKTGSEMDVSGSWKTDRAEGTTTRRYQEKSKTEKRITVKIETDSRTLDIWGGNLSFNNLVESGRDRLMVEIIMASRRVLTVKRLEYIKNSINTEFVRDERRNFTTLTRGFQVFCYYLGYLARPGAVMYSQEEAVHFSNILSERFKPALEYITQMNLDSAFGNRLETFQLPLMTECIMLWRVYICICSGAVKDIPPGTPFSVDLVKKIAESGMLIANEDDYVMALSFFDDLFSFAELQYFLLYVKKRLAEMRDKTKGDVGYTASLYPDMSLWHEEPFYTQENDNYPNYNEINLAKVFRLVNKDTAKEKEVLKYFAEQVCNQYPRANPVLMLEQLSRLTLTDHYHTRVDARARLLNDPKEKGAYVMYLEEEEEEEGERQTYRKKEDKRNSRVLQQVEVKSHDGQKKLISFTLNRSWFDQMMTNKKGPAFDIPSESNGGFLSSIMERAMQFMNYEGMTERKVVLPGMTLNKLLHPNANTTNNVYQLPHIFKTVHFGRPIQPGKTQQQKIEEKRLEAEKRLEERRLQEVIQGESYTAEGFVLHPKQAVPQVKSSQKKKEIRAFIPTEADYLDCKVSKHLVYLSPTGVAKQIQNKTPGNVFTEPSSMFFERNLMSVAKSLEKEDFSEEEFKETRSRGKGKAVDLFSPLALENYFKTKVVRTTPGKKDYYQYYTSLEDKYANLMNNTQCEIEEVNLYN
jgi:hypothetical protein